MDPDRAPPRSHFRFSSSSSPAAASACARKQARRPARAISFEAVAGLCPPRCAPRRRREASVFTDRPLIDRARESTPARWPRYSRTPSSPARRSTTRRPRRSVRPRKKRIANGDVLRQTPGSGAFNDRPDFAERFELYIGGVELCNGFGELTCPREQRSRMEADNVARVTQGKAPYPVDERFLGALAEGMPPSGGNALGFDRLLALCLGADDIQSVCAFPNNWR